MNPRNTILLLLVVLGLGTFWYLHDVKGGRERQESKTREDRLFPDLKAADVTSLRITALRDKRPPLVLEKVDGRWLLRGDRDLLAAQSEVGQAVDQAAEIKRESVILEDPPSARLKEYGLDKPSYTLEIGTGAKDQPKAVLTLGDKTPDDTGYYARTGDAGPVLEVASFFMAALEKPAAELREKNALAVEPGEVSKIRLVSARGEEIVLVEQEAPKTEDDEASLGTPEEWFLEKPFQARAGGRQVSDFLFAWRNATAGRFLEPDEPVDFSKPRLRLEVWVGDDKSPRVLEVGPAVAVKPGMAYVRRLDPEEVMVVEFGPQEKDLLGRGVAYFEDRHLLNFQDDEVERLAGSVEGEAVEARRIRDGWEVEKPVKASRDSALRNATVNDILYALKDLEWSAKEGRAFVSPRATFSVLRKGGEALGTLRLGPATEDGGALAMIEGSDTVYLLQKDPLAEWRDFAGRLAEKSTPSPSPAAGEASPAAGLPAPPPGGASPAPAAPAPAAGH